MLSTTELELVVRLASVQVWSPKVKIRNIFEAIRAGNIVPEAERLCQMTPLTFDLALEHIQGIGELLEQLDAERERNDIV